MTNSLPPCKPLRPADRELIKFLLSPIVPGLEPHSDDEFEPRSPASRSLVTSERDWLTDDGDDPDIQMPGVKLEGA